MKQSLFYWKLALTNLGGNRSAYFPYMLSGAAIIALFYMLCSMFLICIRSAFAGAGSVGFLLMLSTIIAGLISILIIFYTNSFLMKRRKGEMGLYSVLGMEKRHAARVLLCETALIGAVSLAGGIACGVLFSRLLFVVLLNLLRTPLPIAFSMPVQAFGATAALFIGGYALVTLYNILQLRRADPVALLAGGRQGEREPKSKRLLAVLGALALGGGYTLALTVRTPSDALAAFFFAVLLVIAGTYLLFTAGSIALLKLLRRSERFYYRWQHFIAVSGMIYRMKQNAVGLANICILSTCLLVTLSSTLSLYIGEEESLRARHPYDVTLSAELPAGETTGDCDARVDPATGLRARQYRVELADQRSWREVSLSARREGGSFTAYEKGGGTACSLLLLPLEDYNRLTDSDRRLAGGEALAYANVPMPQTLNLGGIELKIADAIERPSIQDAIEVFDTLTLVLPDMDSVHAASAALPIGGEVSQALYRVAFNLEGEPEAVRAFVASLDGPLDESFGGNVRLRDLYSARDDFYAMYGSLLFIGLFFVAMFLIATVLIIYYKQISEGYDDRGRFQIMQKVGLSRREVRRSIHGQVLMVFFLPLSVAILHIAVAFPVLCKLLVLFNLTNTMLFLGCTAAAILVFALCYYAIYQVTAGTYYRIVERGGGGA